MNKLDYVRNHIPAAEVLAALAEESAELSQAALKLRRAIDQTNPTPVTREDALSALRVEIADVMLCLKVLDMEPDTEDMRFKVTRWVERLGGCALDDATMFRALRCCLQFDGSCIECPLKNTEDCSGKLFSVVMNKLGLDKGSIE